MAGLILVVAVCGCNSEKENADDTNNTEASSSSAPQTPIDDRFVRSQSSGENDAKANKLVDELKLELKNQLAVLKEKVEAVSTDEEKTALYVEQNPVPIFVESILNTVASFPESPATFDGALACLGYADNQQRDVLMNYLLDQWPDRLNHRKIVKFLLKQVPAEQVEAWFQKVILAAPQGVAKAEALMGFKTYFDHRPVFAKTLKANPGIARQIPKEQLDYINSDRTVLQDAAITRFLQTVINDYSDMKYTGLGLGGGETFGEMARRELFELNNLNVGDVAPDIVGSDLDGEPFKLSDYRGKVVMLDFWGQWCPPCRRMYPYERHIVQELSGLPFALIGVNSDTKLETAKDSVRDERLPWRNFWNGVDGTAGPIARQWNISEWPTVYLIDGDGVIRYKAALGEEIERGIETLMAEQGYAIDLNSIELALQ